MDDELREKLAEALGSQYELGSELGRGGMGVVYRATDLRLQRDAAIKVLPPELSYRKDLRERFTREAQLAGGLSHPHIVPIYDVGEGSGLVWYEMAFVDGESVRARVERDGPLTEAQTRRIIREVAWALGYAHARGIIHRDIKPDNIMLERGTGRALVTDFGIAKIMESDGSTQPGMVLGSLMYMAPEQATGEDDIDGRADIYSLGLCAHFMLGGRPPFDKATIITVAARIATGVTPDWDDIEQPIDASLRILLEKCVAANPDDRLEDAEAILDALGPQALVPRPMPASIRRLVRDFMLVPTVGFILLVIDIVAEDPITRPEFIGWMALALCVNFGVTLKKFTERGFRWPDLREGLEMEIARQSEELEATGALKDRFSALVYIANASAFGVGLLQAAILGGWFDVTILAGFGLVLLGIVISVPFAWLEIKILTFIGRLFMKLMPSLPRPEAEGWFSRFADGLLTKLFRPIQIGAGEEEKGLPRATSGWTTSDVGAARRSTRSIDEIFAELPRDVRRIARPARELARDLTASISEMRKERAQLDRSHGESVTSLAASSKLATHTLDQLRTLMENVASGHADAEELRAKTSQVAAMLRLAEEDQDEEETKSGRRRWLGGVMLGSALTGTARLEREDSSLQQIASDITSEWDRRSELQDAWPQAEEDVHQFADKVSHLQASLALHTQRGKRLDPAAAESITECENLLAELLKEMQRYDAENEGGTGQIEGLVKQINRLHLEIESVLEAEV